MGSYTVSLDGSALVYEYDADGAWAPTVAEIPEPEVRSAVESARRSGFDPQLTTEPLIGWKRAELCRAWGEVRFRALSVSSNYGTDEIAVCTGGFSIDWPHLHEAPDPACQCGFYIMSSRADLPTITANSMGWVTLEVEALGVVLVHERGYRAQRQRVLGVHVDRECHTHDCEEPPVGLHVRTLRPLCGSCAELPGAAWSVNVLSLGDLAAALGTECSWGEPPAYEEVEVGWPGVPVTSGHVFAASFGVSAQAAADAAQAFADKVNSLQTLWNDTLYQVWSVFEDEDPPERGTLARNRWARDRGLVALDRRYRRAVLVSDNRPCPGPLT